MQITKSDFLRFLESPLHLWAAEHDALTVKSFPLYAQHLARQGYQVEKLARQVLEEMVMPQQYGDAHLLWQPEYTDGEFVARADAIIFDAANGVYDIYEIKSATTIDKAHKYDATFQAIVCEASIPVRDVYLMHLNKDYVRGASLDLADLLAITPVNDVVQELRSNVVALRDMALKAASQDTSEGLLSCLKPDTCPCVALCHPGLPDESIYDLPRLRAKKARRLKNQGILSIHDIPAHLPLSDKQRDYAQVVQSGTPQIDVMAIRAMLDGLMYPLSFLDYETFNAGVPLYEGHHPYHQMVFQYSLHVLDSPDAVLQHFEFVATGQGDPGRLVAAHLAEHLPESGAVIVWNQSFEAGRNAEMARLYPEHREFLLKVNDRIFDLAQPFREGAYLHPDFRGSWSIKRVLPVLVPELSYADLEVGKGDEAMYAWWQLVSEVLSEKERDKITRDLLAYCKLDTLAMVEIWRHLVAPL